MKPYHKIYTLICSIAALIAVGCNKKLDVKPNQSLVVPTTLADFQLLADAGIGTGAVLGEKAADNYFILDTRFAALSQLNQSFYTWGKEYTIPTGSTPVDWTANYNRIMTSNSILEGLKKIDPSSDLLTYNNVSGTAYFGRAHALFQLAQIFCKQYDSATAKSDLGIPIKLSADINDVQGRATVQKLYDQIISDASLAEKLLPTSSAYKIRPIKSSASALLARAYLVTRQFDKARIAADTALTYYNSLLNLNTLNSGAANPFPTYNAEVIFHGDGVFGGSTSVTSLNNFFVDSSLYRSYSANDLRKTCYYKVETSGLISFKGSYGGNSTLLWFTGIATDEVYLTRAECRARMGDLSGALADLNTLLTTRYKTGTFIPVTATNAQAALAIILQERRKEMPFRGIRWMDLRRLNLEPQYTTTLVRSISGQLYSLPPNDNRWILPIPGDEILFNPMPQNPR